MDNAFGERRRQSGDEQSFWKKLNNIIRISSVRKPIDQPEGKLLRRDFLANDDPRPGGDAVIICSYIDAVLLKYRLMM